MSQIVVLGAGMVGSAIALDLQRRHQVLCVDRRETALKRLAKEGVQAEIADLRDKAELSRLLKGRDLVVCAVPGFLGLQTLSTVIEQGRPVVDISFMPEDALELNELARDRNVTAVVDMGVAPGMDNVILGYHDARMTVQRFECLVGGLPKARVYPFEYKAPFSPIDVIEEYTRPARFVEGGKLVTRPALSEPELVEFGKIGTLEAFNSDGLRSLVTTMAHIPDMKEKTLRYPGHRDLIAALSAGGFFATDTVRVAGQDVRPIDASSAILLKAWELQAQEEEFTVMRVTVEGEEDGRQVRYVYNLLDEYDKSTQTSSMARTTGYACTAVAELLLQGSFNAPGVSPPEVVGATDGCFDAIMAYLGVRGVHYQQQKSDC